MATVAAAALLRLLPTRRGEASRVRVRARENERRNSGKKKKDSGSERRRENCKGNEREERRDG